MQAFFGVLLCALFVGVIGAPINIINSGSGSETGFGDFIETMNTVGYTFACPVISDSPATSFVGKFAENEIVPIFSHMCHSAEEEVDKAVRSASYSSDGSCAVSADCSNNGVCSNGSCACYPGFVTFPSGATPACNYAQKSQLTAFLLQIFIGETGAGQFYLENWGNAGGQLAILIVPAILACICCCVMCGADSDGKGACGICILVLMVILFIGVGVWWLADTILIGTNHYLDGNGIPVKSW